MVPKRKRTTSQDMGYGSGEIVSQGKRRSMGPCPERMVYELSEITSPEQPKSPNPFLDHAIPPFVFLSSQNDCSSEPGLSVEITQADCKAEPEDPVDCAGYVRSKTFQYSADQHIDYSQYCQAPLHPDVDLAMDNDYANDSFFLPSDSNMPRRLAATDFEPAHPAPPSTRPELIHVTMPSGETIKLTPSQRVYARSYYDDLTYDPSSTDYKFTTAAQLLDPKAFDTIGWSPEHYAGLTNRIAVPASAYTPRPKPSASDPVRRTAYTTNHDLALMVGYMRRPITKMYQQGTGAVHPDFPTTWGAVALLTESQLDSLAEFYHQTGGWNEWWLLYPCPLVWRKEDCVWVKRRKMMEFIGIRKPELPPVQVIDWLDDIEEEAVRVVAEERRKEDEREEMLLKQWYCTGGRY